MSANLIISLNRINGELRDDVAELKAKLKRAIAERNHESTRKLDAVQVARDMRAQMDAAKAKLHTLEAAVRAVRDDPGEDWSFAADSIDAFFALVSAGSKDGGA